MLSGQLLSFACLLYSVVAGQELPRPKINWFSCQEKTSIPLICGSLMVPIDYTNASSTSLMRLSMAKLNASKQPKQGTILLNPGGPGQSGRDFLAGEFGAALQVVTGGGYDLIGFDPRCVHLITASYFLLY